VLSSCSQANHNLVEQKNNVKPEAQKMTTEKEMIWHAVTVKYLEMEGGFYGLVSDKGDKFLPRNLAKEYQLPGTQLKVKGEVIKGMITIQQWGKVFNITDVELVKLGQGESKNTY
jgi:hypothetical protein